MNSILLFCLGSGVFGGLHLSLNSTLIKRILQKREFYLIAFSIVVLCHLFFVFSIRFEVGDVKLFSGAGYYFRHGIDFYRIDEKHTQFPFFPFMIYVYAVFNYLTTVLPGINFMIWVKLLVLVATIVVSLMINSQRRLQFLASPIVYMVVNFHGQTDILVITFLLMAIKGRRLHGINILAYFASIATKTWPVILLPVITKYYGVKKTILTIIVATSLLLMNVFIYTRFVRNSAIRLVLPAVLKPGGPVGIWGLSYIFKNYVPVMQTYNLYFFGLSMVIGYLLLWWKKIPPIRMLVLIFLWIYLVIPNWGIQYLIWVLPFLYLDKPSRWQWGYEALGGGYLFMNYFNIVSERELISSQWTQGLGLLLWFYLAWGFVKFFRENIRSNPL